MKYPEYEATQLAQYNFFVYDFEKYELPGKSYIEAFAHASPFADKLKERAVQLGYSGDLSDTKSLQAFLFQLLREEQGIISEENARAWKANLRNWLVPKKNSPAPILPSKRESVYQLCFALKMNAMETGEFFLKAYLERPYNYKDLKEAVYFYCLNNGLHYADAVALYQTAQALPYDENAFVETDTATIGRMICEFHNDEMFLDYVRQNRWSFETRSLSAKKKIAELIEFCMPFAERDYNANNFSDKLEAIGARDKKVEEDNPKDPRQKNVNYDIKPVQEAKIKTAESLIAVIYGYHARSTDNEVDNYIKTLGKDSHFPKLIRENMVSNAQQLSAIQNGTAPYAITRSALVLLSFYSFFADAKEHHSEKSVDLFDQFVDETDVVLIECGYGQLYWRNPYDWMIGYCAFAPDPIEELRLLISEFFSDDDSVYFQIQNNP